MALAHHDAAARDERRRREPELVGAEQRGERDVAPRLELPVRLEAHPRAQVVQDEHLVGLGEPELPRRARVLDRRKRRGAGAAVVTGDGDGVGVGLGHARRDRPHPRLAHELDAHAALGVDALQVVDELRQVLDRVDVVVRRRRDERHAGHGVTDSRDLVVDLVPGQLPAFAGLGALRDLDLQLVGVDEVVRRDAESGARHLLDGAALEVPVGHREEASRVLAALARVRAPADAVHRDRQVLVRFLADAAEAHRSGREPPDDVRRRLDLLDGNGRARGDEIPAAAQRVGRVALLVDRARVVGVRARVLHANCLVQAADGAGRPQVPLAADAPEVRAADVERVLVARRFGHVVGRDLEGRRVAQQRLAGDLGQPDAADARRDPGEPAVDRLLTDADRLEDLRPLIARQAGDAHLAHDLQQALVERMHVVVRAVGGGDVEFEARDRLEGQVRVHRSGAVADEERDVRDLARLAALDDEAHAHSLAGARQRVVHGARREEARDGGVLWRRPRDR